MSLWYSVIILYIYMDTEIPQQMKQILILYDFFTQRSFNNDAQPITDVRIYGCCHTFYLHDRTISLRGAPQG